MSYCRRKGFGIVCDNPISERCPRRALAWRTKSRKQIFLQMEKGQSPALITTGKTTSMSDNFAPFVVPGVQFEPRVSSDAEFASGDQGQSSGDRVQTDELLDRWRNFPDWLQPFTEGLVEGESGSSGSAGETFPKTPPPQIPARPSNRPGRKV